jgi:uncharacterized glyoxalase superfamily protein PhnB
MDMYQDWPRLSSALCYDDAATAIDWLCRAFGFEVRIKVPGPDNTIIHSELVYEDAVIMVGSAVRKDRVDRDFVASPRQVGGKNTQWLGLRVDDVDAHCARARRWRDDRGRAQHRRSRPLARQAPHVRGRRPRRPPLVVPPGHPALT